MKNKIVIVLFLLSPFTMQAQFGNLLNKAKSKVEQRVDRKTDRAMDAALDKAEGKEEVTASVPKKEQPAPAAQKEEVLTSFSKYDFVPGEKIIYAEDFAQDAIGELPLNWNTNGKAELVTLNAVEGKWLQIYQNAIYLTANKDSFSKNFTIEFDAILQMKPNGWLYPQFSFGFFASGSDAPNDNAYLKEYKKNASLETILNMGEYGSTSTYLESYADMKKVFYSERQSLSALEKLYSKVTHVSMQVQDRRIRIWFNGEKKFDIPMAVTPGYSYNQLFFKLSTSNYKDDMLSFYIGNLKIATGKPDTRHKLIDEGKFSTTGILFDSKSAVIRPESAGVIKEIGTALKENPAVKIRVIGHTSSDGDDASNLDLSKKRAAAVKEALVKEYEIDEARIETDGKGEAKPVADNKTKEGRAQNRRVEFIKL